MAVDDRIAETIRRARQAGRVMLDEYAAKQIVAAYGIPVPKSAVLAHREEVTQVLRVVPLPVAVKIMSPDIVHKSDVGGVKVNLETSGQVLEAVDALAALAERHSWRVEGFLVEGMAPAGIELVIGGTTDPRFGPVVMVGLGGIFVEVLEDVAFRICPITEVDASEMIDELRAAPLLSGYRGRAAVSKQAIVDALLRVGGEGGLLLDLEHDVREIDLNPLIVSQAGAVAVDARLMLSRDCADE